MISLIRKLYNVNFCRHFCHCYTHFRGCQVIYHFHLMLKKFLILTCLYRKIIVWLLKSSELNYDFLGQIAPWFVILTSLLASGLKYFQYEQEFNISMTVWCISIYFLGRGKCYSINRVSQYYIFTYRMLLTLATWDFGGKDSSFWG